MTTPTQAIASQLDGVVACIRALREAEAHIRATAYDFHGGERQHHLQAADKARAALSSFTAALEGQTNG